MVDEEGRLERIEATSAFAAQLARLTFMRSIQTGTLSIADANLMMEVAIRRNRTGNAMHQRVAELFEKLRTNLTEEPKPPSIDID